MGYEDRKPNLTEIGSGGSLINRHRNTAKYSTARVFKRSSPPIGNNNTLFGDLVRNEVCEECAMLLYTKNRNSFLGGCHNTVQYASLAWRIGQDPRN